MSHTATKSNENGRKDVSTSWSHRIAGAALGALLGAALLAPAQALEYDAREIDGRRVIIAQGEFVEGDAARFAMLADRLGRIDEVWFHSPGGAMHEGYRVGRMIRARGITTRVPAQARCASACADAFLGGVRRFVDVERSLGVHMPTMSRSARAQDWVIDQVERGGNAGSGDVIRNVEQLAARVTAEWVKYLVEMGVSTELVQIAVQVSANDMRWLSAQEMRALRVVTQSNATREAGASPGRGAEDGLPRVIPRGGSSSASRGNDGLPRIN